MKYLCVVPCCMTNCFLISILIWLSTTADLLECSCFSRSKFLLLNSTLIYGTIFINCTLFLSTSWKMLQTCSNPIFCFWNPNFYLSLNIGTSELSAVDQNYFENQYSNPVFTWSCAMKTILVIMLAYLDNYIYLMIHVYKQIYHLV